MDEAANGAPGHLRVRIGEPFKVELPANPTAGYAWRADFAGTRLELVEREVRPAGTTPGAAGVERFVFLPRARGECPIRFTYGRAWEAAPVEERVILVEVE